MQNTPYIINWIKKFLSIINAKKIVITVIALLLVITPTLCAFGYIIYNDYFKKSDYFSVTLYDTDNNIIAFEEDNPENAAYGSLVQIFCDISSTQTVVESTADTKTYIRAVTEWNGIKSELKCYFSTTDADGFYTDNKGNTFKISEALNKLFIETEYAEIFYKNSKVYSLTTIDFDTIVPSQVSWNYKTAGNKDFTSKYNKTTEDELTYEVTGAIDIDFEKAPDYEHVCVYDQDTLIYEGNIQKLSELTVASGNTLKIVIEAEWYKSHNPERYGVINYDFYVRIKNSSNFSINANTVKSGEFVILSCTNVTDISKISFTSDWEAFSPIFGRDSKIVKAVIPFKHVESPQEFNFTVSYGASRQSFTINVLPSKANGIYSDNTLLFDNVFAPQKTSELIIDEILSYKFATNELFYFQGNFVSASSEKFDVAYTHNSIMYWGEELEYFYNTVGNEYIVKDTTVKGESVLAMQTGAVALVGESENLGKFVVIDHGCGLRTWYTNLSFTNVEQGDILLAGQSVGKTGILNNKEGFKLYCTAYDTLIDPNILILIK